MKDSWYGDSRDLVKWGTLVHLAHREGIERVVQIAFLRKEERPYLRTGRGEFRLAEEVWEHFRNVESVKHLGNSKGFDITVIAWPFDPAHRQGYVEDVAAVLRREHKNKVVLLDPDTGIEPRQAKPEHIKKVEIRQVWDALNEGDWLVLYQHRFRMKDWRDQRRRELEHVCMREAKVFESREMAQDVVFFAARK